VVTGPGARIPAKSVREKRQSIVCLRGLLIVASGALLFETGPARAGAASVVLLTIWTLSDLLLLSLPVRLVRSLRFELIVGAIDLLGVGVAVALARTEVGPLPVSCLVLALVLALAQSRSHAAAGTLTVGALHTWSLLAVTGAHPRLIAPQLLLLAALALYYGYLAEGIHSLRRKQSAEEFSRHELRSLLEILDAVASTTDLNFVVRVVVQKIAEVVPAVRCSMLFIDNTRSRCFVMASHDNPELRMLEISLAKYPEVRRAIESRSPVLVKDVERDPLMSEVREALQRLELHSVMVVPMIFGDELLGTLCMKTARANQPFSERELNFCTAVARASASALKNASLHQEVLDASIRHRALADKLSRIFDHSPDLILTTDPEGRITELNRATERLLGCRRDGVLGLRCDDVFGEEVAGLVERTLGQGPVANHACRLRRQDGSQLEFELNVSQLKDASGESVGTVWLGRDVSELRATHRRLLQAGRLSAIGEVIAGVAHELNNPLSGVLGYSQLLLGRHAAGPLRREVERVHESALRCQKIVGNLLSFARGHRPERRLLGLNGIVEKTLDIKRYQLQVNNIEVARELDAELPLTLIDFHQMQQVLLNLFNNAERAMTAVRDRPGRLRVRTSHDADRILLEVEDNGEGMSPQTLERIFEPFFTTQESGGGTGLGLSVSYGIVHEHGGRIHARSRKGEGTTFVLELPICGGAADDADGRAVAPAAHAGRAAGERILVVDDEPLILDLLVELLSERGYRVDTASGGEEACRKIALHAFDLVLTDVRMPRLGGIDLYRRIIAFRPQLAGRVIFCTGDLLDRETLEFLAQIGARTLAKPLDVDATLRAVTELLQAEPA